MVDVVDQLKTFARTHERGFPQTLLYTNEHHQADLAIIAEVERLRTGIKRLSDEEELCAETTGDDPFSLVYLAAKLAKAEVKGAGLRDELDEARNAPWPEWASSILKTLQHYGYDPVVDGEVDLGEAFKDYLEGVSQAEEQDRKRSAEKDQEIERLRALLSESQDMHLSALRRNCTLRDALGKISSPTQTEGLLWWQVEARAALDATDTIGGDHGD